MIWSHYLAAAGGYHRWWGFSSQTCATGDAEQRGRPASRWSFLVINALGKVQLGNSIIAWWACQGSGPFQNNSFFFLTFSPVSQLTYSCAQEIYFLTEEPIRRGGLSVIFPVALADKTQVVLIQCIQFSFLLTTIWISLEMACPLSVPNVWLIQTRAYLRYAVKRSIWLVLKQTNSFFSCEKLTVSGTLFPNIKDDSDPQNDILAAEKS